jgi:hypothetical protein
VTARNHARWGRISLPHPALVLVGSLAIAALAGGQGVGCAGQGHSHLGLTAGDDGGPAGGDDGGGGPSPKPSALGIGLFGAACNGTATDWSPVRRISRVEYNNMVRDLLGDTTAPASSFVAESPLGDGINFQANTYTGVGATDTIVPQQYLTAAESLAATTVANANALTNLFNMNNVNSACSTQNDACAQAFINSFANSAFRGQFDTDEGTSLFQNVYTPIKSQFDFTSGIQAVITAVLTSPRFLYVLEFGQSSTGNVAPLTGNELATRLALFLWRSIPDATLLQAAAGWGSLPADQLKQQVNQQATRMLADKKAVSALDDFAAQWMEVTSAATLARDSQYTIWNSTQKLAQELLTETLTNYHGRVLNNGTYVDLLSSPQSYVNSDVAAYYAGSTSFTGSPSDSYMPQMVSTSSNPRAGILTNPIVLAAQSHTSFPSPTLRGKLVREQILCDAIQPPPAGLNIGPPPATVPANATVKDQYAAHTVPGSVCANCHNMMDSVGDAFGVYDAAGIYQTTETDQRTSGGPFPAIDPSGQVAVYQVIDPSGAIVSTATGEFTATFTGPVDLATQLANATQARECFALQELRYSLSRVETAADACSAQQVYKAFSSSNFSLQQVLLAVVQSDAFLYRSVVTPGSACQ